ncbi:hypothetical protein [Aquamicrobium defluvii]|uniref:Uncharacterized protein n=1 Tax=Aquamicrobium defluvii TaxID=69279 RepID=A0A4R6Y406_9HYPH|nr:hypothetical protein [Aquamicrobium defluvii]TDR27814.1 hypothetical protein DES43_1644 [Aquamicrobium defluvii]
MSSEIVKALKAWDTYDPNISEEKVLRQAHAVIDAARPLLARIEALEAEVARLREALEPFAAVAEHDIGDDETDDDIFWPISNARYSMSGRLRVGHLRAARRAREGGNADG